MPKGSNESFDAQKSKRRDKIRDRRKQRQQKAAVRVTKPRKGGKKGR